MYLVIINRRTGLYIYEGAVSDPLLQYLTWMYPIDDHDWHRYDWDTSDSFPQWEDVPHYSPCDDLEKSCPTDTY